MSDVKNTETPSNRQDSSSLTIDKSHTHALMSKLQAFLPQMEASNQALSTENPPRVDLQLESDKDDDADNDDEESESTENKTNFIEEGPTGENPSSTHPTIQIEFALGNMKENPIIKLLAGDDESDDESKDDDSANSNDDTRKRAVTKLLAEDDSKKCSKEPPSKKKSLITEL